jgi:hypothetical protein
MRVSADVGTRGVLSFGSTGVNRALPGFPEPYRAALAILLEGAPPMAYELAEQGVAEEIGEPPERAFASFDRRPLAA